LLRYGNKCVDWLKAPGRPDYIDDVSTSHKVEQVDLRLLVGHRECVQASDTLETVYKRFAGHEYEFMLVMDGECCRMREPTSGTLEQAGLESNKMIY
jgi:hypothetical protein